MSINPQKGVGGVDQFSDCLEQFENVIKREKLTLGHAVQMTVFIPSDRYEETVKSYRRRLEAFCGGPENAPPVSFIGQAPVRGKMAAMEAVVLAPKEGHTLMINRGGILTDEGPVVGRPLVIGEDDVRSLVGHGTVPAGVGDARYCIAEVDGKKWVYSAGLCGNPSSSLPSEKGLGALAKEMAILLKEGVFDPCSPNNLGLLNSHHYVHDIVGNNYNDALNVPRDFLYTMFGVRVYPSATGIGQFSTTGDMIVEFTAAKGVEYTPVIVKEHGEAYQYADTWLSQQAAGQAIGRQVSGGAGGKVSPPKFSRAIYLPGERLLIISGTASVEKGKKPPLYSPEDFMGEKAETGVLGVDIDVTEIEESAGRQNLMDRGLKIFDGPSKRRFLRVQTAAEAQAIVTIRNKVRLMNAAGLTIGDMAQCRDYITHPEDEERVISIYEKVYGNVPMVFVRGPVCYRNWINESEGIAAKKVERF
ncbi:MAG: hypothetical protein V1875_08300 [Candidatus Altiarchaeota archaeon]